MTVLLGLSSLIEFVLGILHSGCHSKMLHTGQPKQKTLIFSHFWRLERPRSQNPSNWGLANGGLEMATILPMTSHDLSLVRARRQREMSSPSYKATNSIQSWPYS
jgi:hypothetical protein